jgi:hypothetical protein
LDGALSGASASTAPVSAVKTLLRREIVIGVLHLAGRPLYAMAVVRVRRE